MNRDARVCKALFLASRSKSLFFRILLIAFLMVFGIGSVGQTIPAQAAAPAQQTVNWTTTYSMHVHLPPDLICAGKDYNIAVEVVGTSQATISGESVHVEDYMYGITVDAHMTDKSIATISPDSEVTGDALLASPGGLSPIEAEFVLHAVKAGITSVTFHPTIQGANTANWQPHFLIKVVNCKYKVTLNSSWFFSISVGGYTGSSHLTESSKGEMQLNDSDNSLNGTADVKWAMSSISPGCSQSHKIASSTARLVGTPIQNGSAIMGGTMYKVQVIFDQTTLDSIHCMGTSTGQFAPPPIEVTIPDTGGAKSVDHPFVLGEENLSGITTVYLIPVSAP